MCDAVEVGCGRVDDKKCEKKIGKETTEVFNLLFVNAYFRLYVLNVTAIELKTMGVDVDVDMDAK